MNFDKNHLQNALDTFTKTFQRVINNESPAIGGIVTPTGTTVMVENTSEKVIPSGAYMGNESLVTVMNPYCDMVRKLFKPLPTFQDQAHHATTGLVGETGELRAATDRTNIIEEVGDLRFYQVALQQQMPGAPGQIELTLEVTSSAQYSPTLGTVLDNLHIICADLIDLTKKPWLAKIDLPTFPIWQKLSLLEINLQYFVGEVLGMTMQEIEEANMQKLLKGKKARYASGVHSDEQMINKADKA